jgi:Domain of unknown function (DUF4258)
LPPPGPFDRIEYSPHALSRASAKGVREEHVELALRNPEEYDLRADPGYERLRRRIRPGLSIDVVYVQQGRTIRVITVWPKTISFRDRRRR